MNLNESEGKKNPIQTVGDLVQEVFDSGSGKSQIEPSANDLLTDYVERIIVHKGCGKPLTGMSPKNGWCYCLLSTGQPPELPEKLAEAPIASDAEIATLKARCEAAEKDVVKLTEKLDKASKKISELVKKKGGES